MEELLKILRSYTGQGANPGPGLEQAADAVLKRFALVPRAEYEAHMALLATLQQQITDLENRLEALEP